MAIKVLVRREPDPKTFEDRCPECTSLLRFSEGDCESFSRTKSCTPWLWDAILLCPVCEETVRFKL